MPTEELNIESFEGVNQVFKDSALKPGAVHWSYGLIDDEDTMGRIGGKVCLASSSKPHNMVIDIHHLEFAGDEFVLVHHGSARELFEPADLDAEPTTADGIKEYAIE